jgi:hypothetical protein
LAENAFPEEALMHMHNPRLARLYMAALLLACGAALSAQDWTAELPAAMDRMASSYCYPTVSAAFGSFTYEYTELSSPFARWLEDRLADGAAHSKTVRLVNSSAAAAMDPAFKAVYGDLFKAHDIGALLHGEYFDEGDSVRIRMELTGLSDGVLIGAAEFKLPRTAVPRGIGVVPDAAAAAASSSLETIVTRPGEGDAGLRVAVSTDRGKEAVYREGEKMRIFVSVSRNAYLKVYHVDSGGRVQLIWPNRYGRGDGFAPAGAAIQIPADGAPFAFAMTPPFGTEFIKVVASTRPFADIEGDFSDLGAAGQEARTVISRGLSISPEGERDAFQAEATASYVITGGK